MVTLLDLCVSSLRRGHANLLCIVPIVTDDPRRESGMYATRMQAQTQLRQNTENTGNDYSTEHAQHRIHRTRIT